MLITFFDIKGVDHFESIQHGQTLNQTYSMEVLEMLRETVRG
jgi:hypothetical protein